MDDGIMRQAADGEFAPLRDEAATINDFRLDDKEALVELLLRVQAGFISCRRMASEIVKRVPPNIPAERRTASGRTPPADGSASESNGGE